MSETQLVDVLCGGPGREHEVSLVSGHAVAKALAEAGCDVQLVEVAQELDLSHLREGAKVFNIIHGTYGEDGTLQKVLDDAGVAYLGSDAAASRLCMNKTATKKLAQAKGIPVPWGQQIDANNPQAARDLVTPTMTGIVVKPARDGSSVGLRYLPSKSFLLPALEELVNELGPISFLVEERLPGPEYTVAVLQNPDGSWRALPSIAIVPAEGSYDYAAKYQRDDTQYLRVEDQEEVGKLSEYALRLAKAADCRHFARVDFMKNAAGEFCALEINTLPGFTDRSLVPLAASWAGLDFVQLCVYLVDLIETES